MFVANPAARLNSAVCPNGALVRHSQRFCFSFRVLGMVEANERVGNNQAIYSILCSAALSGQASLRLRLDWNMFSRFLAVLPV